MQLKIETLKQIVATMKQLSNSLDTTLLLAIATETPRWMVVFIALHEPAWIGVTMGVLISWAAKRGWGAWRHNRNRHGLFTLNLWVLVSAVLIMSPVLHQMTQHAIEDVDVRVAVLEMGVLMGIGNWALWAWVILVAQSTFMPLIQAVVAKEVKELDVAHYVAVQQDGEPVQIETVQPEIVTVQHNVQLENRIDSIKQRWLQLTENQVAKAEARDAIKEEFNATNTEVAAATGFSKATVGRW